MRQSYIQIRSVVLIGIAAVGFLVVSYLVTQTYRIWYAPGLLQQAMQQPDWPRDSATAAAQARDTIVNPRGIVKAFDLDAEGNIPTLFSSIQLLCAAGLLLLIARHCRSIGSGDTWLWVILGLGFVYLAFDEGTSLHSSFYIATTSETARQARGVFYYSWIIPASIAACSVGLLYLRFLWRLPPTTRMLFLIAAVCYVGSAVGGEMMQGWWTAQGLSRIRFKWVAFTTLEEVGEMLSITLFIGALLDYMRREAIVVQLAVAGAPEQRTDEFADELAGPVGGPSVVKIPSDGIPDDAEADLAMARVRS